MAIYKGCYPEREAEERGNVHGAIAEVGSSILEKSEGDGALAFGESGARIQYRGNRKLRLRPFLRRRKGNGRGIYKLLRFGWNTHRFARGKRQGFTTLELAGIEVGTDYWLELVGCAPKASKV